MTIKKQRKKPIGIRVYKTAGRVASAKVSTVQKWQDIVDKAMNPVVLYLNNKKLQK